MVLDPLSSLSLVGNVVQFVELGCKLFSKSREIYKSATGAYVDDTELQSAAGRLLELADNARLLPSSIPGHGYSRGEKLLLEISEGCKKLAKDLDDLLRPLRTSAAAENITSLHAPTDDQAQAKADNSLHRKWEAFRIALRRMRKSGEIDKFARKLDTYGQQLSTCLMLIFCDQSSATWKSLQEFYGINRQSQILNAANTQMLKETNDMYRKHLNSLNEAVASMRDHLAANEGLATWFRIQDSKTGEFNETISNLSRWIKASDKLAIQTRLLDSLSYRSIQERQSQIRESHAKTFEWVFSVQHPSSASAQCLLHEWLKDGSGIFWVSGKAGSGKSTLMKFLCTHKLSRTALRSWAGGKQLITARFFFWNAGTTLQKSQEGLLRSILHEVLQKHPNLIEEVFPSEWHGDIGKWMNSTSTSLWSRSQLIDACYRLARQDIISSKFCFFIDGLDEYHGDHAELIDLLCNLVDRNKNVKLCLSSRPWNVFQAAFGEKVYPYLLLEDLTRNDIFLYVQTKLGGHATYRRFIREEHAQECDLVHEVVSKANGVFLWVYLVVRSLQRGLENEDRLPDLQRRLRTLPTDLEDYFRHMLNNVDSAYRVEAAKCFDIALQSKRALSLLTYSFLDEDDPVRLALASPIKPLTASDLKSRCRAMSKRLNARCQDLLEITTVTQNSAPSTAREALLQSSRRRTSLPTGTNGNFPTPEDFQLYRVDFLHRTVRDFLEADEMREMFSSRLPMTFNSLRWLCASFLQQVKCLPPGLSLASIRPLLVTLVDNATCFARESEVGAQSPGPQTDLLDELERVIAVLYSKFGANLLDSFMQPDTFGPIRHLTEALGGSFTAICVRRDLLLYVRERLDDEPRLQTREYLSALLLCALFPCTIQEPIGGYFEVPNPDMVDLLLDRGADPDWGLGGKDTTVWIRFLNSIAQSWQTIEPASRVTLLQVMQQLLDHGATVHSDRGPGTAWADFLVMQKANWKQRGDSDSFPFLLCDVVDALVSKCPNVNISYKGCTIWGHFVDNLPFSMSRRTRLRVLRTVECFLSCGADPHFDYSIGLASYDPKSRTPGNEPISRRLLKTFTKHELADSGVPLACLQKPSASGVEAHLMDENPPYRHGAEPRGWWGSVTKWWAG